MTELVGYRKTYRLRIAIPGRKSIEVTFPYEVVEREARKRKLTIDEFLNRFQAVCEYDNFEGVFYKFQEIPKEEPRTQEDGSGKQ
ncbi:hypothetical protein ES708_10690 [subsurface metagenome]